MKLDWKSCIRIAITVFVLYIGIYYWKNVSRFISLFVGSLGPVFIGVSIAYVLNIIMSFYERHYFIKHSDKPIVAKSRTLVCMIASVVSMVAIIALILMLIVPELVSCIKFLVSQIPPFVNSLLGNDFVVRFIPEDVIKALSSVNWQQLVSKVVQFIATGVSTAAEAIFSALFSIVSVIVTIFISVIFSVYFMLHKHHLKSQSVRVVHTYFSKYEKKIIYFFTVVNDSFHKFIVGQSVEAVILWILCLIGMVIFKFPYAQMVSAFIGFTALIPIAGPYIGSIVGAIMIMTVSPIKALLFLVFIIVLQQIEGNFIYPKVVGKSIGLPSLWVLLGITVGGGMFGIIGMLVGVPIVAAIYRFIRDDVVKKETLEIIAEKKQNEKKK